MQITNLGEEQLDSYFVCLEDWGDEMKEAGDQKASWFRKQGYKRAAEELGDKVLYKEILTRERDTFLEWGISDALYIDDKKLNTGPPPSYIKLKRKIPRRVRRL